MDKLDAKDIPHSFSSLRKYKLVVVVVSRAESSVGRQLYRLMWKTLLQNYTDVYFTFLVGSLRDPEEQRELQKEATEQGDVLISPIIDSSANITAKVIVR